MWKDTIKKEDGGDVDYDNKVHVAVEQLIKKIGYGEKREEEVIARIKLRMAWLRENAEYGGRD